MTGCMMANGCIRILKILSILFTKRKTNSRNLAKRFVRDTTTTTTTQYMRYCDNIISIIKYFNHRSQLMAKYYYERYGTKVNFTPTAG